MASTSRTTILPQSKEALLKSYNARLKDDVRSMLENFEGKIVLCLLPKTLLSVVYSARLEILKLARRESHSQISKTTQCEQDALEMQVRAANMGKIIQFPGSNPMC